MKLRGTWFTSFWHNCRLVRDQRGFTLAELLVALTIFAFGLLAIAGMQITAIRTNTQANSMSTESLLAQGVKEQILALPNGSSLFKNPANNLTWQDMNPDIAGNQATVTISGRTYQAFYDVVPVVIENIAMITVRVTGGGRTATVSGFKNIREG